MSDCLLCFRYTKLIIRDALYLPRQLTFQIHVRMFGNALLSARPQSLCCVSCSLNYIGRIITVRMLRVVCHALHAQSALWYKSDCGLHREITIDKYSSRKRLICFYPRAMHAAQPVNNTDDSIAVQSPPPRSRLVQSNS